MKGLENFLRFINEHYVTIMVCIGLIIGIIQKIKTFLSKSDEEKIEIAKKQIRETMLKMITSAEIDFEQWNKAGEIKRAQVVEEIYSKYRILEKAISQEELIAWIDEQINESLKTLRKIVKENNKPETTEEVIASTQVITSPGEANG